MRKSIEFFMLRKSKLMKKLKRKRKTLKIIWKIFMKL